MTAAPMDADLVLVGGGGAAVALLHRLALLAPAGMRVAVVDPVDRLATAPPDRTWCFWDAPTDGTRRALAGCIHREWAAVDLVSAARRRRRLDLAPLRYAMVRSQDYYARVADAVHASGLAVVAVREPAEAVLDGPRDVLVRTPGGTVRARWAVDSRPAPPARPPRTALLQHFRGQVLRAPRPVFDPAAPVLMDFSVTQPVAGLAFGYCLPEDDRTALVEYTEFSPAVLDDAGYAAALAAYAATATGGPVDALTVLHTEQGAIPMTDAVHARRAGARVVRAGTAGGATRASTGYTFAAMQRQAAAMAAALVAGRAPVPPRAYPRRHAWMDALVLRGLADGSLDGPAFFERLLARNPPARVLRFLDGVTGPAAELAVMATAPRTAMLRAAARDAAARVRHRLPPGLGAAARGGPPGVR